MKICVLGNSHVASLKLGLEKIAGGPNKAELVFFASRGSAMGSLRLDGKRLVAANENLARSITHTSEGRKEIVVDDYDAFLVYGLGFRLPILGRHLTSAVRRQACRDTATASLNHRLCALLRKATDKPVHVGHDPQEAVDARQPRLSERLPYEAVFELTANELRGERLRLVSQPRETFADDWFTQQKFSSGSTRLDIGDDISNELHRDEDNKHMNGEYGRIWLESFLSGPVLDTAG